MLRQIALDLGQSPHTRRDCAKALDNLFHDSANPPANAGSAAGVEVNEGDVGGLDHQQPRPRFGLNRTMTAAFLAISHLGEQSICR